MHLPPKVQDVTIGAPRSTTPRARPPAVNHPRGRLRWGESGEREGADLAAREVEHTHGVVVGVGDEYPITGDGEATRLAEARARGLGVVQSRLAVAGDRPALGGGGIEALDLVVVRVGDQKRARMPRDAERMLESHFGRPHAVAVSELEQ